MTPLFGFVWNHLEMFDLEGRAQFMYTIGSKNNICFIACIKNLCYNEGKTVKELNHMNAVARKTKAVNKLLFEQRLVQIRKSKGLTQTELDQRIGVSQRIFHHYENKTEYPPTQKLIELAQALNMSVDDLLGIKNNGSDDTFQDIKLILAKKLKEASKLPPHDLKTLSTFIEALILKQQVKDNTTGA